MSREKLSPPYPEDQPYKFFPIETYTKELPALNLSETQELVDSLRPEASQLLSSVMENPYFQKNMSKLQKKMWIPEFNGYKLSGIEKVTKGFAFEIASYLFVQEQLASEGYTVTSPEETNFLYEQTSLMKRKSKRKASKTEEVVIPQDTKVSIIESDTFLPIDFASKKPSWTHADGVILFHEPKVPDDTDSSKDCTYIVGQCEYTTRLNLGDLSAPNRYRNRDKINQYRYHRSQKVMRDFFTSQTRQTRRRMGGVIHQQYPDLPKKLIFDPNSYFSVFTLPDIQGGEIDTPIYPKNGRVIRIPIDRYELSDFAETIVGELWEKPPEELKGLYELPDLSNLVPAA